MKVITISREYGAGGHTIGQKVADRLGIEFFDQDIIRAAAINSGIDIEEVEDEEEVMSKTDSFIRAITPVSFDTKDSIFKAEAQAIVKLAQQGPCVILGRCANSILDDMGIEQLSVRLHATPKQRIERVGELLGIDDPDQILHQMRKIDMSRHAYYEFYSRRDWNDLDDFDVALNTGTLGIDACVDIICESARVSADRG